MRTKCLCPNQLTLPICHGTVITSMCHASGCNKVGVLPGRGFGICGGKIKVQQQKKRTHHHCILNGYVMLPFCADGVPLLTAKQSFK